MFCFRFGNLLVRLLVFEFRNIFSALVFSSISYLCDSRFGPYEVENFLWGDDVFKALKSNAEECSLFDAIGRRSCGRSGHLGINIDGWENPWCTLRPKLETGLFGTMRSEFETATQPSRSHF